MFEEVERVKERRRERMERIRTQTRDGYSPNVNDWNDPIEETYTPGSFPFSSNPSDDQWLNIPPQQKLGMQTFVSVLLVGVAYFLFQSGIGLPLSWKESAREVMMRDFNFEGAGDWYEARYGELPAILPTLSTKKTAVPVTAPSVSVAWRLPKSWSVVRPYDPTSGKAVISTGVGDQITIGETGWVTYVGEKPGFGQTVVVRLTKGREVWFGNLEAVSVQPNDFLQSGQVIGVAKNANKTSRHIYVAMKEKEQFIDPLEVISLD